MKTLNYLGGKTNSANSVGRHIAKLLPEKKLYVEPYAGMLGILLNRRPAEVEIANDLDKRIVNWWRMLRDHPDELLHLIKMTPYAKTEYYYQQTMLDDPNPLKSALAVSVVLTQSFAKALGEPGGWARKWQESIKKHWLDLPDDLALVAARIKNVQFENTTSLAIVRRVSHFTDAVMYCDPPYDTATSVGCYGVNQQDRSDMIEAFRECKGVVAISGYNDEWDELDWPKIEFSVKTMIGNTLATQNCDRQRTEKLWFNYQLNQLALFE